MSAAAPRLRRANRLRELRQRRCCSLAKATRRPSEVRPGTESGNPSHPCLFDLAAQLSALVGGGVDVDIPFAGHQILGLGIA